MKPRVRRAETSSPRRSVRELSERLRRYAGRMVGAPRDDLIAAADLLDELEAVKTKENDAVGVARDAGGQDPAERVKPFTS